MQLQMDVGDDDEMGGYDDGMVWHCCGSAVAEAVLQVNPSPHHLVATK